MIKEERSKIRATTDDNHLQFTIRRMGGIYYALLLLFTGVALAIGRWLVQTEGAGLGLMGCFILGVSIIILPGWLQLLFFERTICTVTPEKLIIRNRLIPLFGRHTLPSDTIKQLFEVKRPGALFGGTSLLYAETWQGEQIKLISNIPSFAPAQFHDMEKRIEAFLGIKDKPVQTELEEAEFLRKFSEAWLGLALVKDLQIKEGGSSQTVQQITGLYRGCQLNISAIYDRDETPYTKVTLSSPASPPHPPVDQTPLTPSLLTRLLNPEKVRYRLSGDWQKEDGDCFIDKSQVTYTRPGFEADTEYLRFLLDALTYLWRFYPHILAHPQEMVPVLQSVAANKDHPTHALARRLLQDLAETTQPLQEQLPHFLCQHCWHRFTTHPVKLSRFETITYVGCRACHRTQKYVIVPHVIAVLDEAMTAEYTPTEQEFRLNWLTHRTLFDFAEVEIGQTSDEAVERFMVQLGNDTDPIRSPTYAQMNCTVRSDHTLNENTLRILKQRFASVIVGD